MASGKQAPVPQRRRDFILDICSIVLILPLLAVPLVTTSPLLNSLAYQIAIAVAAAMGVYIMLRMGLVSFTVPAFMAVGGYTAALFATTVSSNILLLMALSFALPALVALPLGALVLRLKGVYFIFITYVTNEILQLLLFELPQLTGGSNGIPGVPAASLFGIDLGTNAKLVAVTVANCIIALLLTLATTQRFRPEFASIDENETLAESLGVAIWRYRMIGFMMSAGVSGLAGFGLVNMLATAHPSSFESWSVNNYLAYVFVGGRGTMLGAVVGSVLLVTMSNIFSGYAQLSAGLFGLLLVVVLSLAPGGIIGSIVKLFDKPSTRGIAPTQRSSDGIA
jgi:branched-chain amino acid transport system permease protein